MEYTGKIIVELRYKIGWSQADLAGKSGVPGHDWQVLTRRSSTFY